MIDNDIHLCLCGKVCHKKIIKSGKNAGKEFYGCSLWPNEEHCGYFHLIDNDKKLKLKVEKRRPLSRKEVKTNDLINKKDMVFITPMTSQYSLSKFKRYWIGKKSCNVEISPLIERETDHIDLWIIDKEDNYTSVKLVPLRRNWMRFDVEEFNLPRIDERLRNDLIKIFFSYYDNYKEEKPLSKEEWDLEDDKLWIMLHDLGRKDKGFLYGNAQFIAFELKDGDYLTVKTKDLRNINVKEERNVNWGYGKFTWFTKEELEPIKKEIKVKT